MADSDSFEVKIGLHQGSVLSPLLSIILMDVVSRKVRSVIMYTVHM